MAKYRPARGGVLEAMEDYCKRREGEVAHVGERAAADGAPIPMKALAGGGVVGTGAVVDQIHGKDESK